MHLWGITVFQTCLWNCLFCLSVDAGLALSRFARVLPCVLDALFRLWWCRGLCVVFLLCVDFLPYATHATASMAQVKVSVISADGWSDRWTGVNGSESTISFRISARADPCGRVDASTDESNWNPDESALLQLPGVLLRNRWLRVVLSRHLRSTWEIPLSAMIGLSAQDEFSRERTRDSLDCNSGSREPSMRSGWAMCLSIEEQRKLSQRLSRSGALTSARSLVHVGRALLSSFSLVIALIVVTS